ncbi:MAG: cation:proton antiporter [Eubacteriales bacterium]|nr:cation:proton antiporter [Eubacteriales bacterium]
MLAFYQRVSESVSVLIALSVMLFAGFLVTRITKRLHLPNVSGFILAGILIGPHLLHLVPDDMIDRMGFVSDIALAFIAFSVGKFFKKEVLRQTGRSVIILTLFESLLAGLLTTLVMYFAFGLSGAFSLILGAIATATAPASTMMTINQYHAHGKFVNTLLQVVALDDVICLLAFSMVAAFVSAQDAGAVSFRAIALPLLFNLLAIALGFLCGFILARLLHPPTRSKDNRLILAVAMLLGLSGVCALFDVSPLLSCMVFGAAYLNLTHDKRLFRQLGHFTPPIMSMFFVISGMNLDIGALRTVGVVGVAYFFIRIFGKYGGAWLGAKICGMEQSIQRYLGLALIPQAGVAIGLAFLGQRLLPPAIGNLMLTIILSSSVLYELIGPVCAKTALILSGIIPHDAGPRFIRRIVKKEPPAADSPHDHPET